MKTDELLDDVDEMSLVTLHNKVNAQQQDIVRMAHLIDQSTLEDRLTGLASFEAIERQALHAIDQAQSSGLGFALLLLNVNRFREVNDNFGHFAGDEFLREIGVRLTAVITAPNVVARIGSDEFAILLTSIKRPQDALDVAKRVLQGLQADIILLGTNVHCSCSIGTALYPSDARSVTGLFQRAGRALASAKLQRGNAVLSCSESSVDARPANLAVEADLRRAIRFGQLELHYQPQVVVADSSVHSAEALVRWRHRERGLIPPLDFIPLAEECGLIHDLGEWVIHQACRQSRIWLDAGLTPLRVAVNVSAAQFRDGGLLPTIRDALADSALPSSRLEVELTETTVMADARASVEILNELSSMGVIVSVDDFGTGYSSMSYLRKFPVDKLKIDRSFIRAADEHPDDAAIVRAIVSLAHSLRLRVVAEGVETQRQLDFLKTVGCDKYQGFLFSPAVEAGAFADLLRQQSRSSFMQGAAMRTSSKLAAYRRDVS